MFVSEIAQAPAHVTQKFGHLVSVEEKQRDYQDDENLCRTERHRDYKKCNHINANISICENSTKLVQDKIILKKKNFV